MSNIPKIIHYCWFGRGKKPKLVRKCIKSWKRYLSDYEFIEWNEDNFDMNTNLYVKQAYESKKYAFVSDYVRLYALYNYGGIYMDTDVEVLRGMNEFLSEEGFIGFEDINSIGAGIIGANPNNLIIKKILDIYINKRFINEDGTLDMTPNPKIITKIFLEKGVKLNNDHQTIDGFSIYPKTYFYPLSFNSNKKCYTSNTYSVHHYAASWHSKKQKKSTKKYKQYLARKEFLCKFINEKYIYIILDFKWILKNKIKKIYKNKNLNN